MCIIEMYNFICVYKAIMVLMLFNRTWSQLTTPTVDKCSSSTLIRWEVKLGLDLGQLHNNWSITEVGAVLSRHFDWLNINVLANVSRSCHVVYHVQLITTATLGLCQPDPPENCHLNVFSGGSVVNLDGLSCPHLLS